MREEKLEIAPVFDFEKTLDLFFQLMNDQEVQNNMGDWKVGLKSKAEVVKYLDARQYDTYIIRKGDEEIGYCGIYVRERHRVGILRIAVLKKYRGKRIGLTNLYKELIEYGFTALKLNTFHATMISINISSYKFHEKIGFREIGRYKDSRIGLDGNKYDEILMELTKEMYYEDKSIL